MDKFGEHRYCDLIINNLICHLTSCDHVSIELCNFAEESLSQ